MARAPVPSTRTPILDLIEDLRGNAEDLAEDMDGVPAHETTDGEAAQIIEEMHGALVQIADGATDPQGIARAVLNLQAPLHPIGNASDTVRKLLKPRRT